MVSLRAARMRGRKRASENDVLAVGVVVRATAEEELYLVAVLLEDWGV